ncbi:MAG: DUF2127 domain-containing protein [Anaeromyxobacteraceae bacterium]
MVEGAQDAGTRAIVVYKAAKSVLVLALLVAIVALARGGDAALAERLAAAAHHHLSNRLAIWVSRALGLVAQGHRLRLVELGLAFEAALSTLEAWALHRGRRWGAWLVLVASLSPVPWEVRAIVHRASPVRLAVLLVNLGIAAYLARGLWRERHAASRPGGPPPGGPD